MRPPAISLTIPMTTVGFPGTGLDEIDAAIADGARLDVINIMDFDNILAFAQANGAALYSFWSVNRDFECPAGAVEPRNPGTCSGITQNPYDFTKIIVQYAG